MLHGQGERIKNTTVFVRSSLPADAQPVLLLLMHSNAFAAQHVYNKPCNIAHPKILKEMSNHFRNTSNNLNEDERLILYFEIHATRQFAVVESISVVETVAPEAGSTSLTARQCATK